MVGTKHELSKVLEVVEVLDVNQVRFNEFALSHEIYIDKVNND